jgi:WD40 repeat protein
MIRIAKSPPPDAILKERLPLGWPGRKKISVLVDMAVPLFIFAATTCRFLSDQRHHPEEQLSTILKYQTMSQKLHKTYLPVLHQLTGDDSDEERDYFVCRFHNIVGAIILLFEPLSAGHLAGLLSTQISEVSVQLDFLHSVLQIPGDDSPIRLLHLSFKDFLTDIKAREETAFWVDHKKRHLSLAYQCLERMGAVSGLRQDICELNSPGVLADEVDPEVVKMNIPRDLRYACLYWIGHLVEAGGCIRDRDNVHQFLTKHILHWIEALSLLKSLHKATRYIQALQRLVVSVSNNCLRPLKGKKLIEFLQGTRGKQVSAFLYDTRRYLLYNFSGIEEAPLQAYYSALIFSPNKSLIRKAFRKCIPNWITALPNVAENWSAVEQTLEPIDRSYYSERLMFSPDGTKLASGPQIWDVTSGQTISVLNDRRQWSVVFLSNHEHIFVAEGQWTIRNLGTGQSSSIPCPGDYRYVVSATKNEPRLVVVRETRLKKDEITAFLREYKDFLVYNIDTRKILFRTCYWLREDSRMFLSSDGRRMALIGQIVMDGKKGPLPVETEPADRPKFTIRLEVWSLENEMPRIFVKDYDNNSRYTISDFSADGSKIALWLTDRGVSVIDLNGDFTDKTLGFSEEIRYLAFPPRENTLVIGSLSKTYLWNLDTDEVNTILENVECDSMIFSPDGFKLAFRTKGGLIKIYDLRADLVSASHEWAYNRSASDLVVFSPCGTMVASAPEYGCRVLIWNVSKRNMVHTDRAIAAGWSFDGYKNLFVGFSGSQQLCTATGPLLQLWSIQSGRLSPAYETGIFWFDLCLALSEDGSKLAGCTKQWPRMLLIVDTKSGQDLVSRELGAEEKVISAKFSEDGSELALGIWYGPDAMMVELRETKSLRLESRWICNTDQIVGQVAFSDNGNIILFDAAAPYTTVWDSSTRHIYVAQTSAMTGQEVFISKDCRWILSPNGTRMLYLPPEVRPLRSVTFFEGMIPRSASVHGNMVALGSETGHVTIMEFDFGEFEG